MHQGSRRLELGRGASGPFMLVGFVLLVLAGVGLRLGTAIVDRGPVFDERWITRPIAEVVRKGWSVDTAIDYQETKGPAMIWPYAAWASVLVQDPDEVVSNNVQGGGRGSSVAEAWTSPIPGGPAPAPPAMLATLRWLSILCFVVAGVLLMMLARVCGVRGPPLAIVALLYILLPYEVILGQLVMGEISFVLLAVLMLAAVCWGMGDGRRSRHPLAGPVLYGLLLTLLLYSRIHAVAFAPAVCLLAWMREDVRSWPWWAASAAAGLLRVPLWVRWDGLVSSDFQNLHGLGLRLDSLTYLGAAMSIPLGIFLLAWMVRWRRDVLFWLPPLGVGLGLCLGLVAMPDLSVPSALDLTAEQDRFQGLIASGLGRSGLSPWAQQAAMAGFAAIGLGGLGALTCLAHRTKLTSRAGIVLRVQALTLGAAWVRLRSLPGCVVDRAAIGVAHAAAAGHAAGADNRAGRGDGHSGEYLDDVSPAKGRLSRA